MASTLHLPFDSLGPLYQVIDVGSVRSQCTLVGGAAASSSAARYGSRGLSASGGYLRIENTGFLNFGLGDFSVKFWARPDAYPPTGDYAVIFARQGPELAFQLRMTPAGRAQAVLRATGSSSVYTLTGTSAAATGVWGHFGLYREAGRFSLRVNGNEEATLSQSISLSSADYSTVGALVLTHSPAIQSPFYGSIDDVWCSDYVDSSTVEIPYLHEVGGGPVGNLRGVSVYDVPSASVDKVVAIEAFRDIYYGGKGCLVGTVKQKDSPSNTPVIRRVRLFRDIDAVCVGETWSSVTGAYLFDRLDPGQTYTALAYDHAGQFESVCASGLKATVAV